MLTADGDQHFFGFVSCVELAGMPVNDGLLQVGNAISGRVFGEIRLNGIDGGLFDVFGRGKVRFPCTEVHHIVSF